MILKNTHAILYDHAIRRWMDAHLAGDNMTPFELATELSNLLFKHDTLIVSPNVYHELTEHVVPFLADGGEQLLGCCRLYFNPWGHASYLTSTHPWPVWQLAPGDLGMPRVVAATGHGPHAYIMDDLFIRRLLIWLVHAIDERPLVGGAFLDDFSGDRRHWRYTEAEKDRVWSPRNGRPGWRDCVGWNHPRLEGLESAALAFTGKGRAGVIVNGSARRQAARLWEGLGDWTSPDEIQAGARKGDLLQVNGLNPDGSWSTTTVDEQFSGFPPGTSFARVYKEAVELADEIGMSLGVAYHEHPEHSIYTYIGVPR